MYPDTSLRELKGIGEKTEELFQKVGVFTLRDILLRYPANYINYPQISDFSRLEEDTFCAVMGRIDSPVYLKTAKSMKLVTTTLTQLQRKITLVWFRKPFIKNSLHYGETYIFYGKVRRKNSALTVEQSEIFTPEAYEQMMHFLQPVYSLTAGLTNKAYQKTVQNAFRCSAPLAETLPEEILLKHGFLEYMDALDQIHFPSNEAALQEAGRRLKYEEFYHFLFQLEKLKRGENGLENSFSFQTPDSVFTMTQHLPYELTRGQQNALKDILTDMGSSKPMRRLLQGDVGCGKTIIAFFAMVYAGENGYQSTIMVPTEVLARQHRESFLQLCERFRLTLPVFLLTGSLTPKEKKEVKEKIKQTPGCMVIGTHALIQEDVEYLDLALVITDEQHRFGVRQREILGQKGNHPHILVMSATPIPRTLAIILYGDLSISMIKELPSSRKPIKNCVVKKNFYRKALEFIEKEVSAGHQAYVICPLVEESDEMDGEDVLHCTENLQSFFEDRLRVESLHGKMKPREKADIMERYLKNQIQVLVSTTVVEVGVNVPNATVMLILNAEHFGLAQLHQLRGRVGRSSAQSYCILMDAGNSTEPNKRLDILNHSNDGFEIAEKDLQLRGPGDFFGIRQSGEMNFYLADIYRDSNLLQLAADDINEQKRKGVFK